jgi:hypothetical protein
VLTDRRLERLYAQSGVRDPVGFAHDMVETWATYQGLGRAAAAHDSLGDSATMTVALAPALVAARLEELLRRQSEGWVATASRAYPAQYNGGEPLAVRDVVFGGAGDSARLGRALAAKFRAVATPATFETMARRSGGRYEDVGVFETGQLAPELERAVRSTPVGGISPVVATPYGAHVLYRPRFVDVAASVGKRERRGVMARGQAAYMAALDSAGRARLVGDAVAMVRAVARAPEAHAGDSAVVATSAVGLLTAGRVVWWCGVFPEAAGRVTGAPDSLVRQFIVHLVGYEVMLRSADSAGVVPDSAAMHTMRRQYRTLLLGAWRGLGVEPGVLGAGSTEERTRRASTRVDAFVDRLFAATGRTSLVYVAPALTRAVAARYPARIDRVVLDSMVARVSRARAREDSVRQATMPKSAVPMPGQH